MAQTYCAVNGESKDINISGNRFLDKLTMGLWDLVGIPRPLSEEDSKLVARMLRNYARIQCITLDNDSESEQYFFWDQLGGYRQEHPHTILWLEEIAAFFEESGGLMDEDVWFEKYDSNLSP